MCIKCGVSKCEMVIVGRMLRSLGGSRCGYLPNWKVTGASYGAPGRLDSINISYGKRKKKLQILSESED